jgi:copper oxidase (laccase) domain-containing protein
VTGREIRESCSSGPVPLWTHPEWADRWPWLAQGTTGRGEAPDEWDLGLSGAQPVGPLLGRWRRLREELGFASATHARQVHGADVFAHETPPPPGLLVMEGYDGHLAPLPGLLLTVSVADCTPVFVVDAPTRTVVLLHAGWRGTAAGIVERVLAMLHGRRADREVWLHCGPAICGGCYEVGPEVHAGVNPDQPVPEAPAPIDLRTAIARRAKGCGVPAERITRSTHCTRCGPGAFFSHRAGSAGRQMALLGVR